MEPALVLMHVQVMERITVFVELTDLKLFVVKYNIAQDNQQLEFVKMLVFLMDKMIVLVALDQM